MLNLFERLFLSILYLLAQMSPYLILGFLIAGVLKVFVPQDKVISYLGGRNLRAILLSVVVGIPIPLCSCGVLPVVASLRRQGASKPATLAFLVSTPTTGLDSILATYSLMGPIFAIFRPIAAFVSGIVVGLIATIATKKEPVTAVRKNNNCNLCSDLTPHRHSTKEKLLSIIRYAYFEIMQDIGKWILIGILIGGAINTFVPAKIIENYAGNTTKGIIWMIAIGIPLYVCATGSIPIAASLIAKGMSPGAALVFLIAGPATNTVGISVILKAFGKKLVAIYLVAIILTAITLAFAFDTLFTKEHIKTQIHIHFEHQAGNISPINIISAIILFVLIIFALVYKRAETKTTGENFISISVPEITCSHCEKVIRETLLELDGITNVYVDIKNKKVSYCGTAPVDLVKDAIRKAGYKTD